MYNPLLGISTVNVSIKLLREGAKTPTYGTAQAAGADLYALPIVTEGTLFGNEAVAIEPGQRKLIETGIAIQLPEGFEAQVRPRSGLALKQGITVLNSPGTIDSDYRGEIGVVLQNNGSKTFYVNSGDRIAQLVVTPVWQANFDTVKELGETDRGEGGYGSTGVA
jgi:dUTP pyrophosphatase